MNHIITICRAIIVAGFLVLFLEYFCSCSTQKVVTVTEYRDRVKTDTVNITRVDSVYVSHYLFTKGDTVHMRDTIYQYRVLHDTETKTEYVRDSVPYPVEIIKEVRTRNAYDRFTSAGFWIFVVLALMAVAIRIARWYFKLRL